MRDTKAYAFSSHGPWTIDPAELCWLRCVDQRRQQLRALVPVLTQRRGTPPVRRFAKAALSLGGALVRWYAKERRGGGSVSRAGLSQRLRDAFEELGPPYIKLGQILSSGHGIFPDELVSAFRTLRDRVTPEPFSAVRRVLEEDLGSSLEDVFASFAAEPMAAASIAQVHQARLRTGEHVVVKIQRPQVAHLVRQDLQAMAWIAPWLVGRIPVAALANPPALVELFAETILEELDFRLEAANMLDIAALLAATGQRNIIVPRPHPIYVTERVLVMEQIDGMPYEQADAVRAAGIDTAALLRTLVVCLLEGAMLHGVFHGDLHGGNMVVTPSGQIGLFDYGITARMDHNQRLAFLRLMVHGMLGNVRAQIAASKDLGALSPTTDIDEVVRKLKLDQPVVDPTALSGHELAREIQYLTKTLLEFGAKLPKPLMLFVKNLIFLDDAVAHLAPEVNIFTEVLRIYAYFAEAYSERIAEEIGIDLSQYQFDLETFKAGLGLRPEVEHITHRDLEQRRRVIRAKLTEHDQRSA
ncbi:MAG: AarF/UbiB family protein [Candidatus Binatia bacterium]|nr:AarF/UbiB family protein [Candidatus Binatia bacterium]